MIMDKAKKKRSVTNRKFRRSLPESLGTLSSLVSFDDAETEEPRHEHENKNDPLKGTTTAENTTNVSVGNDQKLTKIWSEQFPSGTLDSKGIPYVRKALSQDWLKTNFSPRPGREPRSGLVWGSDCLEDQPVLSNVLSLRSIPEESELEQDDGSELSDDNGIVEVNSVRNLARGRQNISVTDSIGDEEK